MSCREKFLRRARLLHFRQLHCLAEDDDLSGLVRVRVEDFDRFRGLLAGQQRIRVVTAAAVIVFFCGRGCGRCRLRFWRILPAGGVFAVVVVLSVVVVVPVARIAGWRVRVRGLGFGLCAVLVGGGNVRVGTARLRRRFVLLSFDEFFAFVVGEGRRRGRRRRGGCRGRGR